MSVEVFGRNLERVGGSCGPPGVGFKVTSDGQYDIDNKRLCNVAEPNQSGDAVNLETLQRIIKMEIRSLYEVTAKLRADLDNLDVIIEAHRDEMDTKFSKIQSIIQSLEDVVSN